MDIDDIDAAVNPNIRFRAWVAGHPILAALLIGLVATQMATLIGYYLIGIGLPQLPWPLFNGFLGAPSEEYGTAGSYFVGQNLHFVNGIVFAVLYVVLAYHLFPLPNTTAGNVLRGLIYSTVLAIISMGFLVPYVYAPKQGYGFFSFYTDDGWKLPLSILLWHGVYGFFLGVLYDPSVRGVRATTRVVVD